MDKRRREDRQEGVLEIRIFWGDTAWCPQKTQYVVLGETSVLGRHFCALGRHFRLSSEGTCVLLEQTSSEGILCPGETLQAVLRRHMCPGGTDVLRRHIVSWGDTAGCRQKAHVSWWNRRPQKAYCVIGRHCRLSSEGTVCPGRTGVLRRHIVSLGDTAGCRQKAQCVQVEKESSEGILYPGEKLQTVLRMHSVSWWNTVGYSDYDIFKENYRGSQVYRYKKQF
jgi:hypothetical protein